MFIRMCLVVLCLAGHTAFALPVVEAERLFRLDYNGRTSYLFATADEMFGKPPRLAPVDRALSESCEIWLEGDVLRDDLATRHPVYGAHLLEVLTPQQLRTYLTIVGLTPADHALHPAHATLLARDLFTAAQDRAMVAFNTYLDNLDEFSRRRLLHHALIDPRLREAVKILFGNDVPLTHLLERMFAREESDPDVEVVTMTEALHAQATRSDVRVKWLKPPPGQSITEAQLRHFDAATLGQNLDEMERMFGGADAHSLCVNRSLKFLISWELGRRFFGIDAADYGRAHDLLAESLYDQRKVFPGDDAVIDHEANLHEHWTSELTAAIKAGGAFVALPIDRVIPRSGSRVRQTVLEALEAAGVRITPMAADRATLRRVK